MTSKDKMRSLTLCENAHLRGGGGPVLRVVACLSPRLCRLAHDYERSTEAGIGLIIGRF
jgi:hypothetical protein